MGRENVGTLTKAGRLVKQEDHGVDAGGEIVVLQALDRLVDAVVSQNVVDVGLHPRLQQHVDRRAGVVASIPTHCDGAAILLAGGSDVGRHAEARGGEVRDQVILAAGIQNLLECLVLIGVSAATKGQLVGPVAALRGNGLEVLEPHVLLLDDCARLVASNARLEAKAGFAMGAVAHDSNVDQMRERRHERVDACVAPFLV